MDAAVFVPELKNGWKRKFLNNRIVSEHKKSHQADLTRAKVRRSSGRRNELPLQRGGERDYHNTVDASGLVCAGGAQGCSFKATISRRTPVSLATRGTTTAQRRRRALGGPARIQVPGTNGPGKGRQSDAVNGMHTRACVVRVSVTWDGSSRPRAALLMFWRDPPDEWGFLWSALVQTAAGVEAERGGYHSMQMDGRSGRLVLTVQSAAVGIGCSAPALRMNVERFRGRPVELSRWIGLWGQYQTSFRPLAVERRASFSQGVLSKLFPQMAGRPAQFSRFRKWPSSLAGIDNCLPPWISGEHGLTTIRNSGTAKDHLSMTLGNQRADERSVVASSAKHAGWHVPRRDAHGVFFSLPTITERIFADLGERMLRWLTRARGRGGKISFGFEFSQASSEFRRSVLTLLPRTISEARRGVAGARRSSPAINMSLSPAAPNPALQIYSVDTDLMLSCTTEVKLEKPPVADAGKALGAVVKEAAGARGVRTGMAHEVCLPEWHTGQMYGDGWHTLGEGVILAHVRASGRGQ
ncbi:uncharacterized protein LAESUDRAFT_751130 [Laetiporus sulphureus 93-53]|uniref:Uncharacterized protein n=1 Tax=Laetiporus sulphureus 93-53 TaxID=1314785 RepID=A0A165DBQ1_9APHY|nr:uncharacterized protein LAESUDRAFT_751130 [Laetiporus sulphureus 93-53]KZT04498.1 hypothetical protein LAESUDRAFT_751130 [Laetiporus sulphureus 93-53]